MSIDHISGGRAGWNLVTSQIEDESENFGFDEHLAHAERYERAAEFYEVVTGLGDSWEDEGLLRDKQRGIYIDRDKVHFLDHVGKHFKVKGPLNITRSAQGWPVIAQAGSSEAGRDLAARTADVVFTAQTKIDEAKAFYADIKNRTVRYGRTPDDIKIMPGLTPVLGRTKEEAADGFNVVCNHYPKPFEDFCSVVVPELQRRGIFRTEYEGTTLRENLGLRVPENRYTRQARSGLVKEAS